MDIIYRGFVFLSGEADALAFPNKFLTQLNAPSVVPTKRHFEKVFYIPFTSLCVKDLQVEGNWAF